VLEALSPEGHAVRALYLAAGATDLAVEERDEDLLKALERQWRDMTISKMYLTGGVGSRWDGEAFGDRFELPPDTAYCETCAAVASVQWAWRLLLATGSAIYSDLIERTLYNGVLPGVSLAGDKFLYVNPLQLRADAIDARDEAALRNPSNGRQPWFGTSCCPTNLMRTMAYLQHYFVTRGDDGVQLHQYANSRISTESTYGSTYLELETGYPWDGEVEVRVVETPDRPWKLSMRIPAWAEGATLTVNGRSADTDVTPSTYADVRRTWKRGDSVVLSLPMRPRRTRPSRHVDAVRGCVALERGPLVYCFEQWDQAPGTSIDDLWLAPGTLRSLERPDLLDGVTVIRTDALRLRRGDSTPTYNTSDREETVKPKPAVSESRDNIGDSAEVTAVPYYAWANRGTAAMRVWIPEL
jgi:DUF1680 family protein